MTRRQRIAGRLAGQGRTPDEIREAVYLFQGDAVAKQSRFWLLLVLATGIATAGIVSDSTATVVGAMIVAPLATPIQGAAVAIAYGEVRPLVQSVAMLAGAVAVVIGLAAVLAFALPELHAATRNSQITGRTAPTLVDLAAATFTGLAGAFAIGRRDIGDILPGVAIAISLVPPLCVVGVTAIAGDFSGAAGALVLFLTNVLAIVVTGIAAFSAFRVQHGSTSQPAFRARPVYAVVVIASVLVVGALAAATYRTVQLSDRRDAATKVGASWATDNGERLIGVRFEGDTLVLVVEGMTKGTQDKLLPHLLRNAVPQGTPIVVNRVAGQRRQAGEAGD